MTLLVDVDSLRKSARPVGAPTVTRWRIEDVQALYALPYMHLPFQARQVHRSAWKPA